MKKWEELQVAYTLTITTWSSLCSVIGRENSRHSLNQSNAKLKLASTRAFSSLLVFTLRPHWLLGEYSYFTIGFYDLFGLRFAPLNRKAL